MHLRILPDHQNQVLKKLFFSVWSGSKRVFKHFRILPNHQNQVIKKIIFSPLEWSKTCLMHLLTIRIKSLKNYFLTSGVVKNVFLCIFWPSESSPSKIFFKRPGWLKSCFYAFAHTSRPPESRP
jgi:hypothetical protein